MNNSEDLRRMTVHNMRTMDRGYDNFPARILAQMAAAQEVTVAYTSGRAALNLPPDASPHFSDAVHFAVNQVYEDGQEHFGDALRVHLQSYVEKRVLRQCVGEEPVAWLPETSEEMALVHTLSETASMLGLIDLEPAFQPNVHGRDWEQTDPPQGWYNKYGFFVPGSPTQVGY